MSVRWDMAAHLSRLVELEFNSTTLFIHKKFDSNINIYSSGMVINRGEQNLHDFLFIFIFSGILKSCHELCYTFQLFF